MNPLPECCFPHSAPIPHQFVMKVYVDAWIYVTEKFVNMGNIELYEGVLRYEKADYPPIPSFIVMNSSFLFLQRAARVFLPIIQKEPAGRNARAQNSLPGAKVFFCTHLSVIIEIMRTARGKEVRRHGQ